MGSPLLEAYRKELRREAIRRWSIRIGLVTAGVGLLVGALVYESNREVPQEPQPLTPRPEQVLAAAAGTVDGGVSPAAPRDLGPPVQTHDRGKLKRNQRVLDIMVAHRVPPRDMGRAVAELSRVVDMRTLRPGMEWELWLSPDGRLERFVLHLTPLKYAQVQRVAEGYRATKGEQETHTELVRVSGVIHTSLAKAIEQAGESPSLAVRFKELFESQIDFRADVRQGDQFRMLVQKIMVEDRFVKYGQVLAGEYRGAVGRFSAFRYTDPEGRAGIYDEQGRSTRTMFLKSPVPGARITSGFSLRRLHPIYKRYRPHLGVDYAAPPGTRVLCAADGRVVFAGWKGANGLLLVVKHARGYKTHYAHLLRLARGIKPGVQVRQGQVVAYVGNTGVSTGPHLHYGVSVNGRYVDPQKMPDIRERSVDPRYMKDFLTTIAPLARALRHMALQDETMFGHELVTMP